MSFSTDRDNATATLPTMPYIHDPEPPLSSSVHNNLSSSVPSLSSSRSQASQIAKTYRQAANLFLTRRLPEALSTLEPIIRPPGDDDEQRNGDHAYSSESAPIALASRGSRIKVWVFWLTFLSAVVELGPEEGKHAFGSTRWKELVAKAREGTVWEEVVRYGYGGIEGNVDAEVVVNLATLLLAHSPSQQHNQRCLEAYLSAVANPTFDISSHLSSPTRFRRTSTPGTNTPRDLQTSLKLLELYTLHVLPRNDEWDYAREFIMMSELLDDERKEIFLQALHELKEEKQEAAAREQELAKLQEQQAYRQRQVQEEDIRREEFRKAEEEIRRKEEAKRPKQPSSTEPSARDGYSKPKSSQPRPGGTTASRPKLTPKKDVSRRPVVNPSMFARISLLFSNLQTLILSTTQNLTSNPLLLLRTVLFLLAFGLAFGRREIRHRIKRTMQKIWLSLKGTVGMGVKVSSI